MSGEDITRSRRGFLDEVSLDPGSLVGSWFHKLKDGEIVWQGVVVGEVQPGAYLCELEDCLPGARRAQRIITLPQMVGDTDLEVEFRFYDSEEAMREAFAAFIVHDVTDGAPEKVEGGS